MNNSNTYQKINLKAEMTDFLIGLFPQDLKDIDKLQPLTFTATYSNSENISKFKIEKDAVHFKNILDRYVLGNSYKKHKIRLPGYIVIEGQKHGGHYHLHGCLQYYNLEQRVNFGKKAIRKCWNKIYRSGKIDIDTAYDLEGWIKYTLKDRSKEGCFSDAVHVTHAYNEQYLQAQMHSTTTRLNDSKNSLYAFI